jgi:hypothetical protein
VVCSGEQAIFVFRPMRIYLIFICLRRGYIRVSLQAVPYREVTPRTLTTTDTSIVFHVTHFVILHTPYVSTCGSAGCGGGGFRETVNRKKQAEFLQRDSVASVGMLCASKSHASGVLRHTYCCCAYHFYAYWLYFIYV